MDEPNTGPFCLMRTQPCAHALGVGINHKAATAATKKRSALTKASRGTLSIFEHAGAAVNSRKALPVMELHTATLIRRVSVQGDF